MTVKNKEIPKTPGKKKKHVLYIAVQKNTTIRPFKDLNNLMDSLSYFQSTNQNPNGTAEKSGMSKAFWAMRNAD